MVSTVDSLYILIFIVQWNVIKDVLILSMLDVYNVLTLICMQCVCFGSEYRAKVMCIDAMI